MINLAPGAFFGWITGVLIVALGMYVVFARPRKGSNRAFFLFALGLGGQGVWFNIMVGQPEYFSSWFWPGFGTFLGIMATGAVLLARSTLIGTSGISRRRIALAFACSAIVVMPIWILALMDPQYVGRAMGVQPHQELGLSFALIAFGASMAANAGLGCVAAVRAKQSPNQAGAMAAVTLAALVWPALQSAFMLSLKAPIFGWSSTALLVLTLGWWLVLVRDENAIQARRVATIPLALSLGGYVLSLFFTDPLAMITAGYFGLGRIVTVGILAFAIIRHQILGFDVKVRRGIKGSTLAALFFAVFFVVSETAAELFGGTRAGPFVGIAAAGVLVFFLAPLQRWADRLAGAATGDAKPVAEQSDQQREHTYLQTARAAWADGSLSKDERKLLQRLATTLELRPERLLELDAQASD